MFHSLRLSMPVCEVSVWHRKLQGVDGRAAVPGHPSPQSRGGSARTWGSLFPETRGSSGGRLCPKDAHPPSPTFLRAALWPGLSRLTCPLSPPQGPVTRVGLRLLHARRVRPEAAARLCGKWGASSPWHEAEASWLRADRCQALQPRGAPCLQQSRQHAGCRIVLMPCGREGAQGL